MMFGSLFYNFWAALVSFTVYFIWAVQDPFAYPLPTIGLALVVALIGFIGMFFIRTFIGYVFYTPEPITYEELVTVHKEDMSNPEIQTFDLQNKRTVAQVDESQSEEIAGVVRTMLHKQDEALTAQ